MTVPKPSDKEAKPPRKRRVSARVRKAIAHRVEKGATWAECARHAGMAESGLYKALKQPHVAAFMEEQKSQYVQRIESIENVHKARALEVARDLLDNSKSDTVRARMVEFFRGERSGNAVNVQINNGLGGAKGYEYAHPNSEIVTIRGAQDAVSDDDE